MKYKKLIYLTLFIHLISSGISYSIDRPDIKNLLIYDQKKKIEKVEFYNSENKKVSIDDYKSNLIIINFWASWCVPCKEEMPHLNKLKSKSKFKNIEILPINIGDENLNKSKEFFEKLNINNLEIFFGSSLELAKVFKLRGIPTSIIVDKEGYEVARIIGFIDFENKSFLNWLSNYL